PQQRSWDEDGARGPLAGRSDPVADPGRDGHGLAAEGFPSFPFALRAPPPPPPPPEG
ncbi:hypothetical protein HPB47_019921, partial [Ixodes persulcatus]